MMVSIENIIIKVLFKLKSLNREIYLFNIKYSGKLIRKNLIYDFVWYGGIIKDLDDLKYNYANLHKLLKNVYNDK